MNNLAPFPTQDVPIVGEPFKITVFWPTVVVQCQCDAKATVVLIGTGGGVKCPACERVFAIVDQMQVRVGVMANTPPGVVQ